MRETHPGQPAQPPTHSLTQPPSQPPQIAKMSLTGDILNYGMAVMYVCSGAVMGVRPGGEFLAAHTAAEEVGRGGGRVAQSTAVGCISFALRCTACDCPGAWWRPVRAPICWLSPESRWGRMWCWGTETRTPPCSG